VQTLEVWWLSANWWSRVTPRVTVLSDIGTRVPAIFTLDTEGKLWMRQAVLYKTDSDLPQFRARPSWQSQKWRDWRQDSREWRWTHLGICIIIYTCNVPKYGKTPWLDYRCEVRLHRYPPHLLVENKLVPFDSKQHSLAPLIKSINPACISFTLVIASIQIRIKRSVGYKCYTTSALLG